MKRNSLVAGLVLAATALTSHAITINPLIGTLGTTRWEGTTGPGQPAIDVSLNGIIPGVTSTEVYKQDVGGPESGSLSGSYSTTFSSPGGSGDGASAGQIVYGGVGNIVGPTAYLLVKDGNHLPIWYFYDLTALGWNGTDTVDLSGFWLNRGGAISHATLYGVSSPRPNDTPGVPDGGTTLALLGGSLLGLGTLRRLMRKGS